MFNGFTVTSVKESLLDGNQLKKDSKRMTWKEVNGTDEHQIPSTTGFDAEINLKKVLLKPMQIRSFVLSLKQN